MASEKSSSASICTPAIHTAERELSAFIGAVTNMFGPEQAQLSTEDWLELLTFADLPSSPKESQWRAVTIAAATRLANRLNSAMRSQVYVSSLTDTKVSPIPSSDCSGSKLVL